MSSSTGIRDTDTDTDAAARRDVLSLRERIDEAGSALGFGSAATQALWQALRRGRGGMAQFEHPELGGRGQWMRGGMVMVGKMFDRSLSERVGTLADALARLHEQGPREEPDVDAPAFAPDDVQTPSGLREWPADWGRPATSGSQDDMRYAWFPDARRLVVERAGEAAIYDTDAHVIGGVAQQQGGRQSLVFTSQRGPLEPSSLRRVTLPESMACDPSVVPEPAPADGGTLLDLIERLAALHQRGVLTDDEYSRKKAELLARL